MRGALPSGHNDSAARFSLPAAFRKALTCCVGRGFAVAAHGFRSTFRDWAGEQSAFPREVIEHAMAHQLPDKAEAAYSRATLLPRRVKLMDAWADYAASPVAAGSILTPIQQYILNPLGFQKRQIS